MNTLKLILFCILVPSDKTDNRTACRPTDLYDRSSGTRKWRLELALKFKENYYKDYHTKICVAPTDFFFDLKLMTK